MIEAEQTEDGNKTTNNRLIGVAVHSYDHEHTHSISKINRSVIDQGGEFFVAYNKSRGKRFKMTGVHGPSRAIKLINED